MGRLLSLEVLADLVYVQRLFLEHMVGQVSFSLHEAAALPGMDKDLTGSFKKCVRLRFRSESKLRMLHRQMK